MSRQDEMPSGAGRREFEGITEGEWVFEPGDGGDNSVGLGPTPSVVVAQHDGNDYPICTLDEPVVFDGTRDAVDEYDERLLYNGTTAGNGAVLALAWKIPRMLHLLRRAERHLAAYAATLDAKGWCPLQGEVSACCSDIDTLLNSISGG